VASPKKAGRVLGSSCTSCIDRSSSLCTGVAAIVIHKKEPQPPPRSRQQEGEFISSEPSEDQARAPRGRRSI
jgi:hypothetical protein